MISRHFLQAASRPDGYFSPGQYQGISITRGQSVIGQLGILTLYQAPHPELAKDLA